jgi:simple sugar transport system permease protein
MFENVIQSIFSAAFLASILRVATPILLPSLGALVSGQAGVVNIGLEGTMLTAAFTGVVVSAYSQRWFGPETGLLIGPWLGLGAGVLAAMALALLLGFFHLKLKANLVLASLAINILGSAGTVAIMYELTGDRGNTSTLASLTIPFIQLPEFINQIPIIGPFFFQVFDNQSAMTWVAFIMIFVVWFMLYRTPFGMHLRASGENPSAAESVGIPVMRTRYLALLISGFLGGLGGIHMSMGYLNLFQRDMTSGRGFIALATPLLGGNNPYGTGLASLVFGFFDALASRIGTLQIPSQLPQMIPFVATVMALVIYALQTRQSQRLRALRAAQGEGFDATYWRVLQQLSVLHVLLAMVAIIGIFIGIAIIAAPNGFGGPETANPLALTFLVASTILTAINMPFVIRAERIPAQVWLSAGAGTLTLGAYLTLFFSLFFEALPALVLAVVLAFAVWVALGGWYLLRRPRAKLAAA